MYHYTECLLNNIYLENGYELEDGPSGKGISILDLEGLHDVIAKNIVKKEIALSPKEFKFLRIELDLSQNKLGQLMGVTGVNVLKWESRNKGIPVLADKTIRDLYMESINESPVSGMLKKLSESDRSFQEIELNLNYINDNQWTITINITPVYEYKFNRKYSDRTIGEFTRKLSDLYCPRCYNALIDIISSGHSFCSHCSYEIDDHPPKSPLKIDDIPIYTDKGHVFALIANIKQLYADSLPWNADNHDLLKHRLGDLIARFAGIYPCDYGQNPDVFNDRLALVLEPYLKTYRHDRSKDISP